MSTTRSDDVTLTAAEWDDYDRLVSAAVRAGRSNAEIRILRDGVTSERVRRAILDDPEAADKHGRAILYAEAMEGKGSSDAE